MPHPLQNTDLLADTYLYKCKKNEGKAKMRIAMCHGFGGSVINTGAADPV